MKKPLTNKDGEVRDLVREDIQRMRPASEVLPTGLYKTIKERKLGQRGAQKKPTKILVSARYSPEVIDYFKLEGEGWQIRMNEALKDWIKSHPHKITI